MYSFSTVHLVVSLRSQTINEGSDATFKCEVAGGETVTVEWSVNGKVFGECSKESCTLKNVKRNENNDIVTCKATSKYNKVKSDTAKASLIVHCKLFFFKGRHISEMFFNRCTSNQFQL